MSISTAECVHSIFLDGISEIGILSNIRQRIFMCWMCDSWWSGSILIKETWFFSFFGMYLEPQFFRIDAKFENAKVWKFLKYYSMVCLILPPGSRRKFSSANSHPLNIRAASQVFKCRQQTSVMTCLCINPSSSLNISIISGCSFANEFFYCFENFQAMLPK
jgi:hypothetical protein